MSRRHPGSRHYAALNQRRWAAARRACLARDGHRCTRCGVAGRLEVHHRVELQSGGAAYELANLATLCRNCHIAEHHRPDPERAAWRRLVANSGHQNG